MLAKDFKRTKIVATIGPASSDPKTLLRLIKAGTNGVRLNFSHNTHEWHGLVIKNARAMTADMDRPVAIIADLQGPKIRVGQLPAEGIPLVRGHLVRFKYKADYEATGEIPVQHDIAQYVKAGETMFLRDGTMRVVVEKIERGVIVTQVVTPGILLTNQGINLPDTDLGGEIMTPKDIADLEFAAKNDADYVALSFVQTAEDVTRLRARLKKLGSDMRIIVKIETKAAIENLEAIMEATDVAMVARGDLAIEVTNEAVPIIQQQILDLGRRFRKPVIVATQMLESMISTPQPTRAEVSDVATAVREQADAVMLSGETAMGKFPVETVTMMKRIINYTESNSLEPLKASRAYHVAENAIAAASVILAAEVGAEVIIAETATGQTARNVSSLRPPLPIIMATDNRRVYRQLALVWGGKAYFVEDPKDATAKVMRLLKSSGVVKVGTPIVSASGNQPGVPGGTNTLQVHIIE